MRPAVDIIKLPTEMFLKLSQTAWERPISAAAVALGAPKPMLPSIMDELRPRPQKAMSRANHDHDVPSNTLPFSHLEK